MTQVAVVDKAATMALFAFICQHNIFGLLWLYGISTIVSYLMQNPVYMYITNILFINTFCRDTLLNDRTVLFQTI